MKKLRIFESSDTASLDWFLSMHGDYNIVTRHAFYEWVSMIYDKHLGEESDVVDGKIDGYDVKSLMEKFIMSYAGTVDSVYIDAYNPSERFYSKLDDMPIFRKVVDESKYSREDIADYFVNNLFDFVESTFEGEKVVFAFRKIDFTKNMKELFDEITSAMEGHYLSL